MDRRRDSGIGSPEPVTCWAALGLALRWQPVLSTVLLAGLLACQQGTPTSSSTGSGGDDSRGDPGVAAERPAAGEPGTPYARDLDRICHSEERSGALEKPAGERSMTVAFWLANNIESQEGRDFLARFSQSDAAGKVALLESETRRLGPAECPLIARWAVEQVKP